MTRPAAQVAHRMVWGSGHLTWEWQHALRSSTIPALYAALFLLLKVPPLLRQAMANILQRYPIIYDLLKWAIRGYTSYRPRVLERESKTGHFGGRQALHQPYPVPHSTRGGVSSSKAKETSEASLSSLRKLRNDMLFGSSADLMQ